MTFVMLVPAINVFAQQKEFPKLTGPYLGQKPPGMKPEIFAPGIISTGAHELDICFSADGNEVFYSVTGPAFQPRVILSSSTVNTVWSKPQELPFFDPARTDGYPFLTPDGKRLFFNSSRPRGGKDETEVPGSGDIWTVDRVDGQWDEPRRIDFGDQFKGNRGFASVAQNGNLYFFAMFNGEKPAIYVAKFGNGSYAAPEKLGEGINGPGSIANFHPYIAPDESYLLFDSRRAEDNLGLNDIYISFRRQDGTWSPAKNLGKSINSPGLDLRPFVTFDGKYLFFASDRKMTMELPPKGPNADEVGHFLNPPGNGSQDIYWVDARIIGTIKSEDPKQGSVQ